MRLLAQACPPLAMSACRDRIGGQSAPHSLVGKGAKLPDYVVLISTLGGIEVFGLHVFVIGPLIAAMFMVSWEIFSASRGAVQDGA